MIDWKKAMQSEGTVFHHFFYKGLWLLQFNLMEDAIAASHQWK
jgi:hypothetical protein